ncbi:MAG: NADH:flavin oxidoreductase [Planctomycetota bacterium]|jgi:2,4-dienoyl-CoA reductase-like NADH-dependent reductase (Old Yellow Enzyme family)|nr:NADH:flavin oxidoreductase [Planctomycetota bacterium]
MWTPPERIQYELPEGDWPTNEQAARSQLFSPVRIGPIELAERTWIPAMVPWRATEEGEVTEDVLQWYERFAEGQPGAIVVEATGIRDIPSGPLLRIGHDRFLPGLEAIVERVRKASHGRTRLLIQIIDFLSIRRRPQAEKFFRRFLQVTPAHREALNLQTSSEEEVREALLPLAEEELEQILTPREFEDLRFGARERVTDLQEPHIRDLPNTLPDLFAQAAQRAQKAGFDGVELHYAHAYTMASFLSATNTRDDGYGGHREARIRLPLEVYEAVRSQVGTDYTVGCRYLSEECIEGGSTLEDSVFFGIELARSGMDFLSLSRGGKFDDALQPKVGSSIYPYTGPSGYECMPTIRSDNRGPFGRNIECASQIREAVRNAGYKTPIIVAGGICSFSQAESILCEEKADIIGAARQSLADPDWFMKMRLGRGGQVNRCVYRNYCEGLDQKHKQVTCQIWDRQQLDTPGIRLSDNKKRRLIAPPWDPQK